jgi:hypothetical protein
MNTVRKISVIGIRLVLLLAAPEFLVCQYLSPQQPYRTSKRASKVTKILRLGQQMRGCGWAGGIDCRIACG